jgi:hypothetical protein
MPPFLNKASSSVEQTNFVHLHNRNNTKISKVKISYQDPSPQIIEVGLDTRPTRLQSEKIDHGLLQNKNQIVSM